MLMLIQVVFSCHINDLNLTRAAICGGGWWGGVVLKII